MYAHGAARGDVYRKTEQERTSVGLLIESRGTMWTIRGNGTRMNRTCLCNNAQKYGTYAEKLRSRKATCVFIK
jgi:hypothetical protein